jgi:TolB-like protein/DNA-binding SARP family transcriptional activator/Flp pilus assembly protein TadD
MVRGALGPLSRFSRVSLVTPIVLTLKLFGTASVEASDGPVMGRATQGRRLALLAFLALARGRSVTRDKLIALLWPETTTDRARAQLSDDLYIVRSALGEDVVRSVADELTLNPDAIASDVGTFERLLDEDHLEPAVELYAGPLLDGFHLSDCAEFDHWLDAERRRLGQRYAAALESLAEAGEGRDQFAAAVGWWRKLAAHDPYNGRVALRLMRVLEAAGDRAGALRHARSHASLLKEEFEAEPDPEVTAFAERLRREPPARSAPEPVAIRPPNVPPQTGVVTAGNGEATTDVRRSRRFIAGLVTGVGVVMAAGFLALRPGASVEVTSPSPAVAPTIAVLPFTNVGRDPEDEYLSDGLTEELISRLSRVPRLRVVARTSAFAFKNAKRDVRDIARALNVSTVLEGSVQTVGDQLRVRVQLINAADGFPIWSETYERKRADLLDLQTDVATRMATALEAALTAADRQRFVRRPTTKPEAFTLYLKGRHFWHQRTQASYERAIEHFERAIAIDSLYAAPYAGLAAVYTQQAMSQPPPTAEAARRARASAQTAIALDDGFGEAHSVLGLYLQAFEWDTEGAEREHLRAIALEPGNATAHTLYGLFLRSVGRVNEAVDQHTRAVELDPLSPALSEMLAFTLVQAGRSTEAYRRVQDAIEIDSTYWRAHAVLGLVHEITGRPGDAVHAYERANVLAGGSTHRTAADLARVFARLGRHREARALVATLQAEAARSGNYEPSVATALFALGDRAAADAWLEQAYVRRHTDLAFIGGDPRFASLERDPRFIDLLRRVGARPM